MTRFDAYRESFPNALLTRSGMGALEVALHTDGGAIDQRLRPDRAANVGYGSLADIEERQSHVRFTPEQTCIGAGCMSARCHKQISNAVLNVTRAMSTSFL